MTASGRIIRTLFILLLAGVFAFSAWYLYRKQKERYAFSSFRVEQETGAVMIPDIDRLCNKIDKVDELGLTGLPEDLEAGFNHLLTRKTFRFEEVLSRECFLSWNKTDFSLAFQADAGISTLVELLRDELGIAAIASGNRLEFNDKGYEVASYNRYLVVSTIPVRAVKKQENDRFGNADFILYDATHPMGAGHILTTGYHHEVWEDSVAGPAGKPLFHHNYLQYIPASFGEIRFLGSSRLLSDREKLFNAPNEGSLDWVENGLVILRKDSFCLVIAPQNTGQDLGLLLEEQTLAEMQDTSLIQYFNIGPYEIMPFTTSYNWHQSLPGVDQPLRYYTPLDHFNILANSIPAMRWYLGELQLGNLFFKNSAIVTVYENALPQRAHSLTIARNEDGEFLLGSTIWRSPDVSITTSTRILTGSGTSEAVEMIGDFEVDLLPSAMQVVRSKDSSFLLLSNASQVMLYTTGGTKKWQLNLSTPLTGAPQLIDLEHDGTPEVVLFQQDQFDVIREDGRSAGGFPKKLSAPSKAGLAVNYDDAYNYRFLVNSGNRVLSFDESGQPVEGWLFAGMAAPLSGSISYTVTDGKDLITFEDTGHRQYILSRRGESRFNKPVTVNLPNETPFVAGNFETTSLRRLGYRNNYIFNHYLADGLRDSARLDKDVFALSARWLFNNNHPLLIIEEAERVIIFDEFGYEQSAVLKPVQSAVLAGVLTGEDFTYIFADNSQNSLYLLNGYGKMIFPVPVKGSQVFVFEDGLLYTFAGTKIRIYRGG